MVRSDARALRPTHFLPMIRPTKEQIAQCSALLIALYISTGRSARAAYRRASSIVRFELRVQSMEAANATAHKEAR